MLESCTRPELVTEITLQPVRRHNVDAAVYYSDIVVPLKAIGIDLDIKPGVGPVVEKPIRTRADLAQLRDLTPEDVSYVTEAIGLLTAELGSTPSSASPAARSPSRATSSRAARPARTRTRRRSCTATPSCGPTSSTVSPTSRPPSSRSRSRRAPAPSSSSTRGLAALAPVDYRRSVLPASAKVFKAVEGYGVPRIHFGVGTGELLGLMGEAGRGCRRRRLARPARRGRPPRRPRQGAPGQPRLDGPVRPHGGRRGEDPRGPRLGEGPGGAHLQPRARCHAVHRPGRAHPPRRVRPHADGPIGALTTCAGAGPVCRTAGRAVPAAGVCPA